MTISESELESTNGFSLDDLSGYKWIRQLNIEPYGIIDIIGFKRQYGRIVVHIIELKVVKLDSNHFDQVLRYKSGIERLLKQKFSSFTVLPTLIGLEMASGHYIHNYTTVNVCTFNYGLNGITFKEHGVKGTWYKIDDNFDINRIWQRIAK